MKRFSQRIDLRSRSAMTAYLRNHFRYYTANSWNGADSYACNLKITHLGLESTVVDKLFDILETQEFIDAQEQLMLEFGTDHANRWQARMNGRSGGYLVLYQSKCVPSGYKSFCTHCGQRNYKGVSESGYICGRCGSPSRKDFVKPPMNINIFPGRGTDGDEDYEDWSLEQLRERVRLVQDLDELADRMVDAALHFVKNYSVEEEEYFIPQTRKVLVPCC